MKNPFQVGDLVVPAVPFDKAFPDFLPPGTIKVVRELTEGDGCPVCKSLQGIDLIGDRRDGYSWCIHQWRLYEPLKSEVQQTTARRPVEARS